MTLEQVRPGGQSQVLPVAPMATRHASPSRRRGDWSWTPIRIGLGGFLLAACLGCSPARSEADFGPALQEIRQRNPDVYDTSYEDNLLIIQIGGDWSDAGATVFACEDVKPVLESHGLGDTKFAIYDRNGAVIATGSRC